MSPDEEANKDQNSNNVAVEEAPPGSSAEEEVAATEAESPDADATGVESPDADATGAESPDADAAGTEGHPPRDDHWGRHQIEREPGVWAADQPVCAKHPGDQAISCPG